MILFIALRRLASHYVQVRNGHVNVDLNQRDSHSPVCFSVLYTCTGQTQPAKLRDHLEGIKRDHALKHSCNLTIRMRWCVGVGVKIVQLTPNDAQRPDSTH